MCPCPGSSTWTRLCVRVRRKVPIIEDRRRGDRSSDRTVQPPLRIHAPGYHRSGRGNRSHGLPRSRFHASTALDRIVVDFKPVCVRPPDHEPRQGEVAPWLFGRSIGSRTPRPRSPPGPGRPRCRIARSWPGSERIVGWVKPTGPIVISLNSWWVSPTLRLESTDRSPSMARSIASSRRSRLAEALCPGGILLGRRRNVALPAGRLALGRPSRPGRGELRVLAVEPLERLVGAQDEPLPGRGGGWLRVGLGVCLSGLAGCSSPPPPVSSP